ncbi:MAG: triose-phosphate isomerase [Candidatus Kerfeldbacteria bacterium CG08_land_8_20_14_0_20_40_16]|uniref:Triosephosphate isomerase n=1 Tax=Candidatus Kerfeldbacteria bacterium CG08_land_8_20_14_0_20_40_16 TaxID=2014244 RepID=A0A2H0YWF9_9BACT|nr:MAG: triose-phosphate isomerase [Candidatus Kerfeldbacteria bacterium CG08_land_8_20_14_0_20_40_16]
MDFPIIIGNWKMNLTPHESEMVAKKIVAGLPSQGVSAEIVLCPSFPALEKVARVTVQSSIALGAQNFFWQESGSYTGEVSAKMLKEVGCSWSIIGHSERRINLRETDSEINKKVKLALAYDIVPVICVGEKYEEREGGQKDFVIMREVTSALKGVDKFSRLVIAYEPVWVIGRGEAIDPEEAQSVATLIKYTLRDIYSHEVVEKKIQILYGGSVDDQNVNQFVDQELIKGVLVGGSSLKPEIFLGIINRLTSNAN